MNAFLNCSIDRACVSSTFLNTSPSCSMRDLNSSSTTKPSTSSESNLSKNCVCTRGSSKVFNFFSNFFTVISLASSILPKISVGIPGACLICSKSDMSFVSSEVAFSTYNLNFSARTTGGNSFTCASNFCIVFCCAVSIAALASAGTFSFTASSTSRCLSPLNSDPPWRSITFVMRTPTLCGESSTSTNTSVNAEMVTSFVSSTLASTESTPRATDADTPTPAADGSFACVASLAIVSNMRCCLSCLSATSFKSRSTTSGCVSFAAFNPAAVSRTSSILSLKFSMADTIISGRTFAIPFSSIN